MQYTIIFHISQYPYIYFEYCINSQLISSIGRVSKLSVENLSCMIVSPGNLEEQWQDELYRKFNLRFEILSNDIIESANTDNVFTEKNLRIVRLDKLARNEQIQEKLRVTDWDLIVCDEAHKMSATVLGGEIKYTKRFQLGRLLSTSFYLTIRLAFFKV